MSKQVLQEKIDYLKERLRLAIAFDNGARCMCQKSRDRGEPMMCFICERDLQDSAEIRKHIAHLEMLIEQEN